MFSKRLHLRLMTILAIMLVASLALAACGDDDDDGDDVADEVATPTEQAADPTPTPPAAETPEPEPDPTATPTPDEEPSPTPEAAESPTAAPSDDDDDEPDESGRGKVLVYLVRGEEIGVASREIAGTPEVATGAMNELLTGTTPYEEDLGLGSEIPMETRLLGINIDENGTATVDLSGDFESGGGSFSMQMRVAQVVFTLTQFNTVDDVRIRIEGQDVEAIGGEGVLVDQPLTRDDFEDLSPAILVESPTPGQEVSSPIRLRGTSNVFEATMQIEVVDNSGEIIYEDFATATSGTGERGTFDVEIPIEITREGFGSIIVFEASARDGSRVNVVEIPVDFRQ